MNKNYGVNSEYGKLRKVLVHRPGEEVLDALEYPSKFLFDIEPIAKKVERLGFLRRMQRQHDNVVSKLERLHVIVFYAHDYYNNFSGLPNAMFPKDWGKMLDNGFYLGKMSKEVREEENKIAIEVMHKLGINILNEGEGKYFLEGGDLAHLSPSTLLLGYSQRSEFGSAYEIKRLGGKEVIGIKVPDKIFPLGKPNYIHLDEGYCITGSDRVIMHYEFEKSFVRFLNSGEHKTFLEFIKELNFNVGRVLLNEENQRACNGLLIEKGLLFASKEAHEANKRLKKQKVIDDYIEEEIGALIAGGGGISCMVLPLLREYIL